MAFVLPNLEVTASANFEEVTGNFITLPALTVEAYEQQTLSLPMLTVAATGEMATLVPSRTALVPLTASGLRVRPSSLMAVL